MPKKIESIHARYLDKEGWPRSVSFDEEEFNDSSIDWNDAINGLIAEGATLLTLEIRIEQ